MRSLYDLDNVSLNAKQRLRPNELTMTLVACMWAVSSMFDLRRDRQEEVIL